MTKQEIKYFFNVQKESAKKHLIEMGFKIGKSRFNKACYEAYKNGQNGSMIADIYIRLVIEHLRQSAILELEKNERRNSNGKPE